LYLKLKDAVANVIKKKTAPSQIKNIQNLNSLFFLKKTSFIFVTDKTLFIFNSYLCALKNIL